MKAFLWMFQSARRFAYCRYAILSIGFAITTVGSSPLHASGPILGVGVHSIGSPPAVQAQELKIAATAGFRSIRVDAAWKYVEREKGRYEIPEAWDKFVDLAVANGLEPMLILDYGNKYYDQGDKPRSKEAIQAFIRYSAYIVQHFARRVKYYEIWNEWDNHTGGGAPASPDDYAYLYKSVFPVLKKVDPQITVLVGSGVRTGWFNRLADLNVLAYADGISVHPYVYQFGSKLGPEQVVRSLQDLHAQLLQQSGRKALDIYVTEIGWPTNKGRFGSSETETAAYAERTIFLLSSLSFVKGVWWYDLKDDGVDIDNKEHNFGLLRFDYSKKPAFESLKYSARIAETRDLTLMSESKLEQGVVMIASVRHRTGQRGMIAWNLSQASVAPQALRCQLGVVESTSERSSEGQAIRLMGRPAEIISLNKKCVAAYADELTQ
ncbi:cellulase family glycosylhydrolase [Cupriavidus numazuensis]|nr:cellulase family glycosylhydrolase [Cupriavidus numazuensis]